VSARGNRQHHWLDFGGFYRAQPAWARKLYWFVTIPVFVVWGWFIISGAIEAHGHLALMVFGILFVLGAIHNFYFFSAMGRGRQ
jgi:hypothetical protein